MEFQIERGEYTTPWTHSRRDNPLHTKTGGKLKQNLQCLWIDDAGIWISEETNFGLTLGEGGGGLTTFVPGVYELDKSKDEPHHRIPVPLGHVFGLMTSS